MKCIFCGGDALVAETMPLDRDVYRRRKCKSCKAIFYTREHMVPANDERKKEAFIEKQIRDKDSAWIKKLRREGKYNG